MPVWLLDYAMSQSSLEVDRQYRACRLVEARRMLLALVPFAVAALYLPPLLCLAAAAAQTVLETLGLRLMRDANPQRQTRRYLLMLLTYSVSQVTYNGTAAVIWQNVDGFAKAFAIAMFFVNLIHLATVRAVHLPLTLCSLAVATVVAAVGNGIFWLQADNYVGLTISTLCLLATTYFVYLTATTTHQMHAEMNRDQQAAEAANAAKSRFLAQMSHELRTPLNAILGMGYAEMRTATSDASRDRLSTLVGSARSLSVLLNDILDMSAVEAGQLPIRPTAVAVRTETHATLALFRQQISDAAMTLTFTVDDQVPAFAVMDGQKFRQCLSNILSNAINYSTRGAISVSVSTPHPSQLDVIVADSGPGVPENLRDEIFEPFHRGKTMVAGTGLGLSISRTLARRMGGDLVLMPSAVGARFKLSVALQPAQAADLHAIDQPLADLTGRRVLVVDDVATNRIVAMTYLRIMGATPVEAATGQSALTQIAADPPDVVLLDMFMPELDGMATLQRIRELPGLPWRLPVIAMTADATEERRRYYLDHGLDGYVAKPLSPETLGMAILAVLRPTVG